MIKKSSFLSIVWGLRMHSFFSGGPRDFLGSENSIYYAESEDIRSETLINVLKFRTCLSE